MPPHSFPPVASKYVGGVPVTGLVQQTFQKENLFHLHVPNFNFIFTAGSLRVVSNFFFFAGRLVVRPQNFTHTVVLYQPIDQAFAFHP